MLLKSIRANKVQDEPKFFSVEFLVVLWAIIIGSGSFDLGFNLFYGDVAEAHRFFLRKLFVFPVHLYAFGYLLLRMNRTFYVLKTNIPLSLLFLLMLSSALWSIDMGTTAVRSFDVITGSIFALYLTVRYMPSKLLNIVGRSLIWVCFLTIFVTLLNPSNGIHHDQHFPAMRGYFPHKNAMGFVMVAMGAIGFVLTLCNETRKRGQILLSLAILLSIASLSRSTWLNFGIVFVSVYGILFLRKNKVLGLFLLYLSLLLIVAGFLVVGVDDIILAFSSLLGRDATFTGRTDIWKHLIEIISTRRTWFGFGFESFWASKTGALAEYWGTQGFSPSHAHNGWIQVLVNLGVVGLALQVWAWMKTGFRSYRVAMETSDMNNIFLLLYFIIFTTSNVSENTFFLPENLNWLLFIYIAYCPIVSYDVKFPPQKLNLLSRKGRGAGSQRDEL